MLDNHPLAEMKDFNASYLSLDNFRDCLANRSWKPGAVLVAPLSLGGCANARILPSPPSDSAKAAAFRTNYYRFDRHQWPPQYFILLDQPCFVVLDSGAVILEDGRILKETVYPSSGEKTLSRLLGGGIVGPDLPTKLAAAAEMQDEIWAPLLSRWSNVYFHSVSESMVHNVTLRKAGLSKYVSYFVPSARRGSQELAVSQASSVVKPCDSPIIKVPRVLLSTLLYSHSVMGTDFLNFVEDTKIRANINSLPLSQSGQGRVFVSREGARARQMTNEAELSAALGALGFQNVNGDGQSFEAQVRAYRDAQFIVGAHGAGLLNAAFARPQSTIFELRPLNRGGESPMWGMSYLKLSSIMGFSYCAHVSENDLDSEVWTANVNEIIPRVKSLLSNG